MCPDASTTAAADADSELAKLQASRAAILSVLSAAAEAEIDIDAVGDHLAELLSRASPSSSHLQSQTVAARALRARIDRAVAPAEPLLAAFRRVSALAEETAPPADPADAESAVAFVDRVDQLRDAIEEVVARGDEAVRRVEEAVGFLGRTKAAGRGRVRRLTEAAAALRAVYETEAEQMRFEGPLDEALLGLQDLFEALLLRLKHPAAPPDADADGDTAPYELGTDDEVEAATRMARTLAGNDCLDICLDIYVKTRYRRAAKAMMRLNPAYLKSYTPEAIDDMEWESLESAMALWSPHFHVGIASVLAAERRLCARVLEPLPPAVWPECFAKIAARIVAAFFRFADGVAAAAREPQRLFKLLDMLDAVVRERERLDELFSSESATLVAIRERTREVERALARAAAGVFFEFGLRIETHYVTGAGAGADVGHVPKIVRYAVNYLKCLASDDYRALMDTALRAERERGGDEDEDRSEDGGRAPLAEAASNVLEALHRHVEAARRVCADAVASHVMAMNAYWYIYMRARGSELAKLVGEDTMRRRYKAAAEEAAWEYQDAAWTPLVRVVSGGSSGAPKTWPADDARGKAAVFADMLEDRVRRHGAEYKIPDGDLRGQIKAAAAKAVRGAYAGFLKANDKALAGGRREMLPLDVIEGMVGRVFDEMGDAVAGSIGRARSSRSRRESRDSSNLEGFGV
ncbi:exocyst complex component EXO70A1-like [Panicum miliaceum]|uniref:Exocyst subunit Exo70 family protein n=1 Tax=Panicum miliaceum TaxID=4540 RepID=A0A3L6RK40_PANMI|nr:exocyst complex component EXO70A1-like [Panicum miliaceum]